MVAIAEGTVMILKPNRKSFSRARSRLAFWLLCLACCMGVLIWFLVVNRAPVEVMLPFGFGTRTGPVSIVILVSMGLGALWVVALQTLLSARRHLRDAYRRWNRPRSDAAHRCEAPHIVSRPSMPMLTGYRNESEYADQAN
jgi:uncharacterized integral membrane protein